MSTDPLLSLGTSEMSYRPIRPNIAWANPIATIPLDPVATALRSFKEEKSKKDVAKKEAFVRDMETARRKTTIMWADPIATITEPVALSKKDDEKRSTTIAWAEPIATLRDPASDDYWRAKVAARKEAERDVLKVQNSQTGKTVLCARNRKMDDVTASRKRASSSASEIIWGGCKTAPPTTEVAFVEADGKTPSYLAETQMKPDQPGIKMDKTSAPIVTVREIDVEAESRMERLIRKLKYELAWLCCDFDEVPLSEEEMLLSKQAQVEEQKEKRAKGPSKPAPAHAYCLACGFGVLVVGIMTWVFPF